MTVRELSQDELRELKGNYLVELDNEGQLKEIAGLDGISYEVLININDYVPDDIVFNHYDGIDFVTDDFFCNIVE